jgi:hypothetical protein
MTLASSQFLKGFRMAKTTKETEKPTAPGAGGPNKITLTVVVNGDSVEVEGNSNAPLHTIIPKALTESGNVGQPPENWELKDEAGNVLDVGKKIEEYGFTAGIKLFLSLKAGAAGG